MIPIAAIDVGSNAIRMLLVNASKKSDARIVYSAREAIRLGQDVFSQGVLGERVMERTVAAFVRFRRVLDRYHVTQLRAVATSALREAKNREQLLRAIRRSSGIELEVISAREEARLIQLAVADEYDLRDRLALLIDIGGGSVEVTLVSDGDIIFADSLRLGTVRMLQILQSQNKGEKLFTALLREHAEGIHHQLERMLRGRSVSLCIGSGGNLETLGELQAVFFRKSTQRAVSLKQLKSIISRLQKLSLRKRVRELGLRPDRADVVLPAALVVHKLASFSKIERVEVARGGVKEGIVIDLTRQYRRRPLTTAQIAAARAKQVHTFALELGRQHDFDEKHGKRVAQLAVQLFQSTRRLHHLDSSTCLLLEIAALLHDIGQSINYSGHHKHSYYLIKCCPFVGLSYREQLIVASIARYHRKSTPRVEHEAWAELNPSERDIVEKLAAILRIATALDQEHSSRVRALRVQMSATKLKLLLKGQGRFELERWSVQQKSAMFEQVYGRKVLVVGDNGKV
jgi:exopolyphosphatase/guanosine-5'-triphosphate,3'-diphosphate pyrophosphatase